MITLNQVERLVRRISEIVGQPASDTQSAKLAQDYAALCRDANRRLEQCALMIEAGQSLQALQLAETQPPLLDLITVLSFRQATEWRTFCQGHQLPWTEPFYDKYVRLLNSTYSKGIVSDHPFYRDYRRAVMGNDDDRAISILRVIARLNPSDANTKEELKRLDEKVLRAKLENLRQSLNRGDGEGAQAQLDQIEASGLPVPSGHPVWQQAQVARCQQLLRRAEELRDRADWQATEELVEEIHRYATHYNVQLPGADADAWSALEAWTLEQRAAYANDKDFQRAVSALEYEIQTIESMQGSGARPGLPEAGNISNSLNAKWGETERFNRSLDESLTARFQQCNDWLQHRMQAVRRGKRRLAFGVTFLVLAGVAAAAPLAMNWYQERDIFHRLDALESKRRVADTETLLAGVGPKLKAQPEMVERIAKAQSFVAREKQLKQAFDDNLGPLQQMAAGGFHNMIEQPAARRLQAESALAKLADEYKSAGKSALSAWDEKWQPFRNATLTASLDRAGPIAAGLHVTNGYEAVHVGLPGLQTALLEMVPWKAEPPALDARLLDRFLEVSNQFAVLKAAAEQWETAQGSLSKAESLDDYLSRLARFVQSPFANNAQRDAAGEIARLKMDPTTLLGQLLLPNDPAQWSTLTNLAVWRTNLMPDTPTPAEKDLYFTLRDDKNVQDVNAYQLVAVPRTNSAYQSHPVLVQGAITTQGASHWVGLVYDPKASPDALNFVRQTYDDWHYNTIKKMFRLPECETFERLRLGELIDPTTGNYQVPILQLLDQLNNETKSGALFQAFVAMKLFALTRSRPDEWGLRWCPAAAAYFQALIDLGAGRLASGDWMVPTQFAKYNLPLEKYFAQARTVSLQAQAIFLRQIVFETCQTGFTFAGLADVEGRPVLRQVNSPSRDYWGWGAHGRSVVALWRKSGNGEGLDKLADPLPFTPLFLFAGDKQSVMSQAARAANCAPSQMSALLPPFFSQPNE